jgi:hypothetical protein
MLHNIIVRFEKLPRPMKLSGMVYVTCLLGYNLVGTYVDSKTYLNKYRTNTLSEKEKKEITDDWSAVKYGANIYWIERLWDSIVWPVKSITNVVPAIVLSFNPPKKD